MEVLSLDNIVEILAEELNFNSKFVYGKVYKSWNNFMIRYTGGTSGHGINSNGEWEISNYWSFESSPGDWREISDEEWGKALKVLAASLYKGVRYVDRSNLVGLPSWCSIRQSFAVNCKDGYKGGMFQHQGVFVMDEKGNWATPIK